MSQNPFDPYYGQNPQMLNVGDQGHQSALSPFAATTQGQDPKAPPGARAGAPLGTPTNPNYVQFPTHLYVPPGHTSVDFRAIATVPAGSTRELLWQYKVPQGKLLQIISYGIFNDGDLEANFDISPEVNNTRVFTYHGNPGITLQEQAAHMALGLAPDLSANSLIPCQLVLNPGDILAWYVTNRDVVDVVMGARCVGYFLNVGRQGKVGG